MIVKVIGNYFVCELLMLLVIKVYLCVVFMIWVGIVSIEELLLWFGDILR